MGDGSYSIVCHGEVLDGFDPELVKQNLAALLKQPLKKMERLIARSGFVIKSGLDEARAKQYLHALTKAGLKVSAQRSAAPAAPAQPAVQQAAPPAETIAAQAAPVAESRTLPFAFNGSGGEYFRIWIVNLFLTLLTLGIYSAWAKVRNKQYFYGNTELGGSIFEYTGKPLAILKGRMIAGVFFVAYMAAGQISPILALVMFALLLAALPWMITRSLMFNARNSRYRNVRLRFHGSVKDAFFAFVLWPLAGALTFGILAPLAIYKQQRFLAENHSYGTTPFEFSAVAKDYYVVFGVMLLVLFVGVFGGSFLSGVGLPFLGIPIVLAAYLFIFIYFSVNIFNLRFNNSMLGEHGFAADMELMPYTKLVVVNTLATALTLGLFRPWAMVRTARYKAGHLQLIAAGDLGGFIAHEEEQVGAMGEEMGEMFDFDIGL